ncbi:hypothetical protein BV25DRAFT_1812295, partial [Artomyces pyxidatus]
PFEVLVVEPEQNNAPRPALARTIHFYDDGKKILVGYLDSKELISWSISPWQELWCHKLPYRIASSAWSHTAQSLLVCNLRDGVDGYRDRVDVYHVSDRPSLQVKLEMDVDVNVARTATFAQGSELAVCGNDRGEVMIWEVSTGKLVQTLVYGSGQ